MGLYTEFSDVQKFILGVGMVPDYSLRLKAMEVELTKEEGFLYIKNACTLMDDAIRQILNNERFAYLFQSIVKVGKVVLSDDNFNLASLSKVLSMNVNTGEDFMEYVVNRLESSSNNIVTEN